jgi:phage terminase large subunit-like protein
VTDKAALLIEAAIAERSKGDPLRQWRPLPKQEPFIRAVLDATTWENWFIAANRAGKSQALAYCVAQLARFGTPEAPFKPTTGWVISLDANTARDILQPKLFDNGADPHATPFIPDREIADWKVSEQILRLKNGSVIGFKNCESGRVKFQGVERDYVAFDEEPIQSIYDEVSIRIGAGRRLRIFGAVTLLPPEGTVGGVSWMFPEIIQPYQQGQKPGFGLFGASIYDNAHLPPEEIKRLEAKYPAGSVQRKIRLEGEWLPGLSGARVYAAFDRRMHVKPQPSIMPRRPLAWCWDFNLSPMVSVVGQQEGRLFRVLQEFVAEEGQISEMVDWFRQAIPTHSGEVWIYGDATGKRRTNQTGQSDYTLIMNHMRNYGAVRLKVPEDNPFVRDRVNAVNATLRDEHGEIRLEIDPECKELIADLEQVVSDAKGGIRKTTNRRDPYFYRTHVSDALGYWIAYENPVRTVRAVPQRANVRIPTPGYSR